MSEKVKVLIIRFSSIGDVLLTSPVIRGLKEQLHGENEIHYVVLKAFAPVLENNPFIDKLHVLDDNLQEIIQELKDENFHYVIDLHKNLRSNYFRRQLKQLTFTIRKLNIQKWVLVNFKVDLLPDIHIVDRYFEAVKALGVINDNKGLDYVIPEKDQVDIKKMFDIESDNYVAFAIGAAHKGKKLSKNKIIDLCNLLEQEIILLGGIEDKEVGADIARNCENVINVCGRLNLNQSASVLEQSRLVISHDSGLMHIASAFKKKIISIWGATVPKFGMYAYLPHPESIMIEADHLKFRPTSKLGNRNSKKERRTTDEIDVSRIKDAVYKLWERRLNDDL